MRCWAYFGAYNSRTQPLIPALTLASERDQPVGLATDEFRVWYIELDDDKAEDVTASVDYLAVEGLRLGYPRSSAITGTSFALRELRIQSKGHPIRVFYAFDPVRNAVLIIGGDKTGDNRFYERLVPLAKRIWKEYLDETAQVE